MDELALLLQLALVLGRLSLLSFGGGTAILAEMEREVVGRGWLSHQQFMTSYALGQVTPGPGTTLVVPIGYQVAGVPGGIVALLAFFVPTAIIAVVAAAFWGRVRDVSWVASARGALLPVAVGLTLASAVSLSLASASEPRGLAVTAASFGLLYRTRIPTFVVLGLGGVAGLLFLAA